MRITCERDKLLAAFGTAASVAPARSPKPILQLVKLEVDAGSAVLMATDMDLGIRLEVPGVEIERPGAALLPTARFGAILKESSDQRLVLEADAQGTRVRGERSEFKLPGAVAEEFPSIEAFRETKYHEISARLLREMIRRTVFATDNESTRYALGGVLLELGNESLVAVGTDGRRLAMMEGPARAVEGHQASEGTTIVPTKAMHLIERALADVNTEVALAPRGNRLWLRAERITISTSLVEGRFPKWRDVFPRRESVSRIDLAVGPTYAAVRQAAIVTSDESRGIDFRFADGTLTLTGQTAEVGQSKVELPVAYDGPALEITLDPRYLADFLRVLDPEKTVSIELENADSAAVCRSDDGYGYVIMPLARDR